MTKPTEDINPHLAAISGLYSAFDHFNQHFYGNDLLPRPVINLGPAGRKAALGWFRGNGWSKVGEDEHVHEINISPEYLNRDPNEILETLLHEMAHMRNNVDEIMDCNSTQYHNKHFKAAAERVGLEVEKNGYRGWAWTSLGTDAKQAIDKLPIDKNIFKIMRPNRPKIGGVKYITIALKEDDWLDAIEDLMRKTGTDSKSGAVKAAIEAMLDAEE